MFAHKAKHSKSCPDLRFEKNGTQRQLKPSIVQGQENSLRNTSSHIEVSTMKNKQELKRRDPIHQSLDFKTRSGAVGFKREIADRLPPPKGPNSANKGNELVNPFLEKPTTVSRQKPKIHRHARQHSLELSGSSTRRLNFHYSDLDSPIRAGVVLGASCSSILNNKTLYSQCKYPYLSQCNVWENQSCSEDYCSDRCKKSNLTHDIRNKPERWSHGSQSNSDIRKQDWMRDSPRPESLNQYKEQLQYRLRHRVQYTSFQPRVPGENSRHKCSCQHIRFGNPSSKPLASTSYASNQKQPSLADIEADYKPINERHTTRSSNQQQTTETRNWRSRIGRRLQAIRERLRKAFSHHDRLNN
ncbi:hypothetical protein TNIN_474781 [Trichonephila inaurata madagascariensis]|uniref:Uncharacterized protein n=1 Tax=Trichonephila inaurata madagascariensis TaxID=2747483 RepID=A0A8X6YYP6_9ARAC|nr:hypothetical protein TNIN_474781 [Trichonephila inaurata madagascariensis]